MPQNLFNKLLQCFFTVEPFLIATHARTFRLLHETQESKESVNSSNIVSERYSANLSRCQLQKSLLVDLLETYGRIRELSRGTLRDSAFSHSGREARSIAPRTADLLFVENLFAADQSRTQRERMYVIRARICRADNDIPSLCIRSAV